MLDEASFPPASAASDANADTAAFADEAAGAAASSDEAEGAASFAGAAVDAAAFADATFDSASFADAIADTGFPQFMQNLASWGSFAPHLVQYMPDPPFGSASSRSVL